MAARPADDAISRYMANRVRAAEPTAAQAAAAEATLARRSDEYNQKLQLGKYRVHTDSVTVDPATGIPVGDAVKPAAPTDWSSYLGIFGMDAGTLKEINAIFARTPDISQAVVLAQAYVRGTPWYTQTYPGIQEALAKGVVRDEREYRSKLNDFNQTYRQWTGNDIALTDYAGFLKEGVSADTVGRRFAGDAYAAAGGTDWRYLSGAFGDGSLSSDDVKAVGRQQAGLGSQKGINLQAMLERAQQRLSRISQGTLATLAGGALSEPTSDRRSPDIGR